MSYLADLVKSLNEDEIKQFLLLDVKGKEELVRDAYAKLSRTKKFSEEKLPAKLGLSQSHFDQINSVLLAKTFDKLWGDNYRKAFVSIQNKGLAELMLHLIKTYEKRKLQTRDKEQITAYYKQVIDTLLQIPYPYSNAVLRNEYAEKYLASLGSKKRLEEETRVAMIVLMTDIANSFFNVNQLEFKQDAERTIAKWKKKAEGNAAATFYVALGYYELLKYTSDSAVLYAESVAQALQAFYKAKGMVEDRWERRLLGDEALSYLAMDNYAEALARYSKLMTQFPDTVGADYAHLQSWFNSAICARELEQAEHIFNTKFWVRIQTKPFPQLVVAVCSMGLYLALHQKNITWATELFNQIMTARNKDLIHTERVLMRMHETAYFYFSGDYQTALKLSEKHLNYLKRSPNAKNVAGEPISFIECINKFAKYRNGQTHLRNKTDRLVNGLATGVMNAQNLLLRDEWAQLRNS